MPMICNWAVTHRLHSAQDRAPAANTFKQDIDLHMKALLHTSCSLGLLILCALDGGVLACSLWHSVVRDSRVLWSVSS